MKTRQQIGSVDRRADHAKYVRERNGLKRARHFQPRFSARAFGCRDTDGWARVPQGRGRRDRRGMQTRAFISEHAKRLRYKTFDVNIYPAKIAIARYSLANSHHRQLTETTENVYDPNANQQRRSVIINRNECNRLRNI